MLDVAWDELDARVGWAEARLPVHHAIQLVAAVGEALAPRAGDDAQQSLAVGRRGWLGAPVAGGTLRAGIDPVALELWLVDGEGPPLARLPLAGRTLAEGLAFLSGELHRRGVTAALALPRHPADFPAHPLAEGARFEAGDPGSRRQLARLFTGTGELLAAVAGAEASPLRLWPHHFDLACNVAVGDRTLGLGVSPGDGTEGRPYWYAAPFPALPREEPPVLEGGGSWHLEGWTGAELPIDRLQGGAAAQRVQVGAFFRSALGAARLVVGRST